LHHIPEHDVDGDRIPRWQDHVEGLIERAGMPTRMAQAIKQLHAGPRFMLDFNMFRLTEYYLRLCSERDIKTPMAITNAWIRSNASKQAMNVKPLPTVPCNNDLLAENYIDMTAAIMVDRLRIQRQQRPDLRVGQYLPGNGIQRRADRRGLRRVFWGGNGGI
jgi:hypothetical protein